MRLGLLLRRPLPISSGRAARVGGVGGGRAAGVILVVVLLAARRRERPQRHVTSPSATFCPPSARQVDHPGSADRVPADANHNFLWI